MSVPSSEQQVSLAALPRISKVGVKIGEVRCCATIATHHRWCDIFGRSLRIGFLSLHLEVHLFPRFFENEGVALSDDATLHMDCLWVRGSVRMTLQMVGIH